MLAVLHPAPLTAQSGGGEDRLWSFRLGGGTAFHGSCGQCDADRVGPAFAVGVERRLSDIWALGATWTGSRLSGRFSTLSRRALSVEATHRPGGASGIFVRASLGTAVSTVIDVDGPPDSGGVGDVVIAIGDTQGLAVAAAAGWSLALGPTWGLAPEARWEIQRVAGQTISLGTVMIQVVVR